MTARIEFVLSPLGFHGWAEQNLQAYRDLPHGLTHSPVPYFALCRAIELEFKAWHRQATTRDVLSDKFGHDLVASYRRLPAKHQILSAAEIGLMARANKIYPRTRFACFDLDRTGRGFHAPLELEALEALTEKILEYGDTLKLTHG